MSCVTVAGFGVDVIIYEIQPLVHIFQERHKNIGRGNSLDGDGDERTAKRGRRSLVLAENVDDDVDSFAFVHTSNLEIISSICGTNCVATKRQNGEDGKRSHGSDCEGEEIGQWSILQGFGLS